MSNDSITSNNVPEKQSKTNESPLSKSICAVKSVPAIPNSGKTESLDSISESKSSYSSPTPIKKSSSIHSKRQKFKNRSYTLDQLWKKNKQKHATSSIEDINVAREPTDESTSLQDIPNELTRETTVSSDQRCTQIDIRSRLNNLAFIFSLPHLVMLSNLQKLIGIRTGKKPSIQVSQ